MTTLNKRITELTELLTADDNDLIAIVDITSPAETKKIKKSNLVPTPVLSHSALTNLTADDHLHYLTEGRGDARYLQTETDPLSVHLDQTTPQEIINGIPLLEEIRNIQYPHELADKQYVDEAVTALGIRFYMLDDADVTGYKLTSMDASADIATYYEAVNPVDDEYIMGWISPVGMTPPKLIAGHYDWNIFKSKTSGNKTYRIYWKLYERLADSTEVELATSNVGNLMTVNNSIERDRLIIVLDDDVVPAVGSRIIGKVFVKVISGASATNLRLHYRGDYNSHWETPTNTEILSTMFAPLDGSVPVTKLSVGDTSTYLEKDISGNLTFTDVVVGTRTLKQLGCPTLVKLSATGQSAGSLNLTGFGVSKVWLKRLTVELESGTSTDFDIEIYEKDTFLAADRIYNLEANNADVDVVLDYLYEDLDASDELHIKITDNAGGGSPVFGISLRGIELI